ncbi:M64 family metallopeptidase [Sunxiuqinia sp. A32]|uniref:M64 family metallopeptidase n=1 Tax=Sunxiuqinia sp. A32 TaxID=3461496 RepID=UPI00404595D0
MIKKSEFLLLMMILSYSFANAQVKFNDYFSNKSLRVDYLLIGTDTSENVIVKQLKKEPNFAGPHNNLIEEYDFGTYRYRAFDLKSRMLIYSRGFCPLFQEWQTTTEAKEKMGSYYQVAILPFPKNDIRFVIEKRDDNGLFTEIYSQEISPNDYFIIDEISSAYKVEIIQKKGIPEEKVDLVLLPEGYTKEEMGKFHEDAQRMIKALFKSSAFKKFENAFNVYTIDVPSIQSGTDVPGEHVFKNTAFNSSFYTFDTPRYLTTSDLKSIHDAAAVVPYDHIYILVNTDRYGGGGFYNFISVTSVDHEESEKVFIHEFGHGFAGLADEYYSSSVAYDGYYNLEIEPWEPNITTMIDFDSKWENMISKDTPVPTLRENANKKTLGAFEGGGYSSNGIYSPMMDCRMKSNEAKNFCPVCERAIEMVIQWHCK